MYLSEEKRAEIRECIEKHQSNMGLNPGENNMINKRTIEHFKGCIIGGAIGDALGAPIEFMSIDQIRSEFGEMGLTDYSESWHLFDRGWSINRI